MSGTQSSDAMKNLALFLIGLAVVVIILALAMYFSGILPVHPAPGPEPLNAFPTSVNDQITDSIT